MKKLGKAIILGFLFGLFCCGIAILREMQFSTLELAAAVYNRTLIGLFIGVLPKFARNKLINAILKGGIIGALISLAMIFPYGFSAMAFVVLGAIYGMLIDFFSE